MACALARSEAEVKGSRCPGMMWEESRMTLKTSILGEGWNTSCC